MEAEGECVFVEPDEGAAAGTTEGSYRVFCPRHRNLAGSGGGGGGGGSERRPPPARPPLVHSEPEASERQPPPPLPPSDEALSEENQNQNEPPPPPRPSDAAPPTVPIILSLTRELANTLTLAQIVETYKFESPSSARRFMIHMGITECADWNLREYVRGLTLAQVVELSGIPSEERAKTMLISLGIMECADWKHLPDLRPPTNDPGDDDLTDEDENAPSTMLAPDLGRDDAAATERDGFWEDIAPTQLTAPEGVEEEEVDDEEDHAFTEKTKTPPVPRLTPEVAKSHTMEQLRDMYNYKYVTHVKMMMSRNGITECADCICVRGFWTPKCTAELAKTLPGRRLAPEVAESHTMEQLRDMYNCNDVAHVKSMMTRNGITECADWICVRGRWTPKCTAGLAKMLTLAEMQVMYDLSEPVVKAALIQRGITQCADWTAPPVQAVATPQPLTLPGKQIEPAAAPRLTIAAAHDKSAGAQPSYQAPVYNKNPDGTKNSILAVDPPLLDFGPIASDDVGDHLVTIKNTNKEMPVDFTAPRIKFFKTTPSSGVIPAGQQVSVVVRYEPKNLGAHGERLAINALGVNGEIIQTTTLIVKGVSPQGPSARANSLVSRPHLERSARWNPTPAQLARLEELFLTGMGTPKGEQRTQITEELAKLGPINEANVFNWFKNKKSKMKRDASQKGGHEKENASSRVFTPRDYTLLELMQRKPRVNDDDADASFRS